MADDVCRYCDCSDSNPCEGGCSWSNPEHTICSQCVAAIDIAEQFVAILGLVAVDPKTHLQATTIPASWDALPLEQQRLLVNVCRYTVQRINDQLLLDIEQEALDAGREVITLVRFLEDKCPEQLTNANEPLSATIIRLLEPHVGSRIVLAGGRL